MFAVAAEKVREPLVAVDDVQAERVSGLARRPKPAFEPGQRFPVPEIADRQVAGFRTHRADVDHVSDGLERRDRVLGESGGVAVVGCAHDLGAERDRYRAFGVTLANDVLVELSDDFARGQLVQREVLFFSGSGKVDSHSFV